MQYISPFHILPPPSSGTIDRKDILLARKKIYAELELNDGNGIKINGKEFFKNDIEHLLNILQEPAAFSYHLEIYRDKVLLRFLEFNAMEENSLFAANQLYTDEAFIECIGPYYAHAFTTYFFDCYLLLTTDEWNTLMNNPLLMSGHSRKMAWNNIEKRIRADVQRVEFLAEKKLTKKDISEAEKLCDFRRLKVLLQLPPDRFSYVRDEMSLAITQLCDMMFNQFKRDPAITNIVTAHTLAASEEIKELVKNKRLELEEIAKKFKKHFWSFNTQEWSAGEMAKAFGFAFIFVSVMISNAHEKNIAKKNNPSMQQEQPFADSPATRTDTAGIHQVRVQPGAIKNIPPGN